MIRCLFIIKNKKIKIFIETSCSTSKINQLNIDLYSGRALYDNESIALTCHIGLPIATLKLVNFV